MKGKNKFTEEEIDQLKNLVRKFSRANDASTRKTIRSQFRKIGFHVSDFGIQNIDSGKFESLIRSGRIQGSSKIITQKQRIKESSALKKPIEEHLAINLLDEKLINGNFTSAGDLDSKDSLDSKGFYCIKTKEKAALPPRYQRHLKKNNPRIIYIGKAENATLRKRFLGQELRARGHGTFFRSLGAVLEYTPEPGSLLNYRNKNNYKFSPKNENEIINWINCNLEVNWVSYNGDFAIEADLIKKYKPLLNDTHNPSRLPELREDKANCRSIACQDNNI